MRERAVLDEAAIERLRQATLERVAPLNPGGADFFEHFREDRRTDAGRTLPPYFLVYFLLVDLLGFPHAGQDEKVAWTVPVELRGHRFLLAHRKMGVGVFGATDPVTEAAAREVVTRIHRGCKTARPFFDHLAAKAVLSGRINVLNHGASLYGRYEYLRGLLSATISELELRTFDQQQENWRRWNELQSQVAWLHQSVFEAFFSWLEHALVHIAILKGRISDGLQLRTIVQAEWTEKFRTAFDLSDPVLKRHYDALLMVRREHRNFTSHGAFGKDGEAFQFHSGAGAVSIRLTESDGYTLIPPLALSDADAMASVEAFVSWLQTGQNEPLWIYLHRGFATVVPWAGATGRYRLALSSPREMEEFLDDLERLRDDSANMDW